MNGDGKPDIAYIHSDHIGNSYNSGGLIIASLQADNQFEQLTSLGYFQGGYEFPPSRYNWWFTNVGNGKTSVIQNQNLGSNWDCSFVETKLFIWDDNDQLVNHSIQEFYPDTFGCLVAQAEQEMWSHNYSEAVTFYERALDLDETSEDLMPHTAIRLGLAYLLTEQFVKAEVIYETLSTSESDYVQTILETYYRDPRALPICQTMYNYPFDGTEYLQSNGHFETYSGGFNRFNVGISYFSLENATCDLGHVLDAQLQTMSFVANESPFPQIQSLGLEVANAIEIDFTMDGKTEWLIWLDAPGLAPMLFSTNDDNYEVTRIVEYGSILRQSTEYNHYGVMTLPNRSEQVLVNIDYDIDLLSEINCASSCGGGGGYVYCGYGDLSSTPRHIGSITLWQMQEESIGYSFMKPVCDLLDVNDIISSDDAPLEIHAGKYVFSAEDEFSSTVMPAVYSWDSKLEAYVLTPEPSPTPVSTLTSIPEIVDTPQERVYALSNYDFNQLRQTFNEEDYEAVVRIVDASLSNPDSKDYDIERFENPFRYYRALALEELNKKDEALVDYITIYESQPDSAWGILAQLHLVDLDR